MQELAVSTMSNSNVKKHLRSNVQPTPDRSGWRLQIVLLLIVTVRQRIQERAKLCGGRHVLFRRCSTPRRSAVAKTQRSSRVKNWLYEKSLPCTDHQTSYKQVRLGKMQARYQL